VKHKFVVGGVEYGGGILRGGVEYEIDINGGGDLRFGVAACGSLKFSAMSPHPFSEGVEFTWLRKQIEEESFSAMGVFTVRSVTKRGLCYDVEATDGMSAFNVDAKLFLDAVNYPTNHFNLLSTLCVMFGVSVQIQSMANSSLVVSSSPYWDGATVRDIISMLAEASGCFAHFLPNGEMHFGGYRNVGVDFTKSHYSYPFIADYLVAPIDKVQIRATQGDIGTIVGNGQNTYIVEGNPMFAVAPAGSEVSSASLLLNAISGITYTPCEIPLFNDNGVRVGDAFTIDGVPAVAMSYRCTPRGTVISCTGSPRRDVQSTAANRDVIALLGRTNELTRTSELTESRLTDAEGEISLIRQTSDEIVLAVGNQNIKISSLETEISGVVKFSNLTDGVTQISGDNITTGTIRAINIDGCVVTSNGDIYTDNTWAKSKVTVTNGAIQFKCEFDTGVTTLSQLSSHGGLSLSSTSTININSTESITLEGPGVIFAITGNMYVLKNGYFYEVIHSGNIHQYV
jgi:hypothetical protein